MNGWGQGSSCQQKQLVQGTAVLGSGPHPRLHPGSKTWVLRIPCVASQVWSWDSLTSLTGSALLPYLPIAPIFLLPQGAAILLAGGASEPLYPSVHACPQLKTPVLLPPAPSNLVSCWESLELQAL